MSSVQERLYAIRQAMADAGCDAYIMPSSDPHASEYAPHYYTAWEYYSGFSCENANLVVTKDEAALWVDGRFFGAADAALEGSGIASMHMGVKGVPTVNAWIADKLESGQVLGYTAANVCLGQYRGLQKDLEGKGIVLKAAFCDDAAWGEDREPLPATECWILEKQYAGLNIREKLEAFRGKWNGADAAVVTKLDSIAWLLNLRAYDIDCTPYAIAFAYVKKDGAVLFINQARVSDSVKEILAAEGVELQDYEAFASYLAGITETANVLIDGNTINASLYKTLEENPACQIVEGKDEIQMLKAVKNETEIACTKEAHLVDGVAMVRFQKELEERLAAGETLRETDIDKILHKYRSAGAKFVEESFPTIAAYGPNAAMMHYAPVEGKDAVIERKGYLLVDSGATYLNGTTDITRTYTVGPMTEHEKEMYTLTLISHIDVANIQWLEGMKGGQLDMFARQPFWKKKLDYRCGTGHSVSHVGAVHEGPHSLRYSNEVPFVPGMVITDEPGFYEEGVVGIRIENELVCVDAGESEYGHYLSFEPIMYVPINMEPVIIDMLNNDEIEWINHYHEQVYEKLSPRLTEEECAWLKNKCKAVVR